MLSGWAPEQNRQLGVYYAFRDIEMAYKTFGFDSKFPFAEDLSLWQVLELGERVIRQGVRRPCDIVRP